MLAGKNQNVQSATGLYAKRARYPRASPAAVKHALSYIHIYVSTHALYKPGAKTPVLWLPNTPIFDGFPTSNSETCHKNPWFHPTPKTGTWGKTRQRNSLTLHKSYT